MIHPEVETINVSDTPQAHKREKCYNPDSASFAETLWNFLKSLACFSATDGSVTASVTSPNMCTHQTGPTTAQTESLLRACVPGGFTFWGGGLWLSFSPLEMNLNNKTAECVSSRKKESKPTTGKLKSSNRPIMHCWDILEIMAFVRLGLQILTFLHSPVGTNETLWQPSYLSLGWHWQEQLHLYQSRVFCAAKTAPALITTFITCKSLLSSYKHSTHPFCCLDLIILSESHIAPSKGLAEKMDKRKRDEKKLSKEPAKRLQADSSPLEYCVLTAC